MLHADGLLQALCDGLCMADWAELVCADCSLTCSPQYFASVISSLLVVAWIGQQVHNLLLTYLIGESITTHKYPLNCLL